LASSRPGLAGDGEPDRGVLAHEDCAVSGQVYSVAGGRVARVVIVETDGLVLPEITAEAMRDHVSELGVLREGSLHVPESLDDETTIIAKALAAAS